MNDDCVVAEFSSYIQARSFFVGGSVLIWERTTRPPLVAFKPPGGGATVPVVVDVHFGDLNVGRSSTCFRGKQRSSMPGVSVAWVFLQRKKRYKCIQRWINMLQ